jgi:hypothetical protein
MLFILPMSVILFPMAPLSESNPRSAVFSVDIFGESGKAHARGSI